MEGLIYVYCSVYKYNVFKSILIDRKIGLGDSYFSITGLNAFELIFLFNEVYMLHWSRLYRTSPSNN